MKKIVLACIATVITLQATAFNSNFKITNNTQDPLDVILYDKQGKEIYKKIVRTTKTISLKEHSKSIGKITWQNKLFMGQKDANKENPLLKDLNYVGKENMVKLSRTSGDNTKYELTVDIGKRARGYKLTILEKGDVEYTQGRKGKRIGSGVKHLLDDNNN